MLGALIVSGCRARLLGLLRVFATSSSGALVDSSSGELVAASLL